MAAAVQGAAPTAEPDRRSPLPAAFATGGVLVAWCLLALGDSAREGEFTRWGLTAVVAGFVITAGVIATRAPLVVPDRRLLVLPLAVCVGAATLHPASRYMHVIGPNLGVIQKLAATTAIVAGATLTVRPRDQQRHAWTAVALLAIVTGVVTITYVTDPGIDVWYLLQQSSSGLVHGHDMYRQHWQYSTGLQDVYPYLPGTTLLLAPFKWLAGDVRFGLLAALVISAVLVRRLAPAAPVGLAALLLVMPHMTFLVDQSWTEPILIAALAGTILAIREDRPGVAIVALAIALASKQHIVLLLPLFAIWPNFGWRRTLASGGLAVIVVLPWIIAGPRDLWHDAVRANLDLGVLQRALCLPSLFSRYGYTAGFWLLLLAISVAYAVSILRLPRTASGLALGSALVMWAVDIANKQSFFNHYQLPLGLLVVALAAAPSGQRPGDVTLPTQPVERTVKVPA